MHFTLHQNYPNPFNPTTTLKYDLPEDSFVDITVYDMLGNVVRNLINTKNHLAINQFNGMLPTIKANLHLQSIYIGFRQVILLM